ncbi:MAG: type VI secretion system tube protein Hcp [Acetobacteraceae bacterium]|nr:type VI secretion system tube protein Hcp [Acetobacteraceae bacterium]
MAEQIVSDLIMQFVKDKKPIVAEAQTELDLDSSDMTKDFQRDCYFEVQSFSMKTGLSPDDEDAKKQKAAQANQRAFGIVALDLANDPRKKSEIARTLSRMRSAQQNAASGFEKWRAGQDVPPLKPYNVDMDPFEFTRAIDKASGIFWKYCIDRVSYDSATLIKRRPTGTKAAGEVFLRMDFTKVLVIGIDWDQDEPIKEKCKFISRAVTIHYLPQLPDGTLGAPVRAFWTMNPGKYNPVNL